MIIGNNSIHIFPHQGRVNLFKCQYVYRSRRQNRANQRLHCQVPIDHGTLHLIDHKLFFLALELFSSERELLFERLESVRSGKCFFPLFILQSKSQFFSRSVFEEISYQRIQQASIYLLNHRLTKHIFKSYIQYLNVLMVATQSLKGSIIILH